MRDGSIAERKPTALYRHFDMDGALLYVGVSLSPLHRLAQHGDRSSWHRQIASITLAWFDTRAEALQAETAAIKAESPAYNRQHSDTFDIWALLEKTEPGRQFIAQCDAALAFDLARSRWVTQMAELDAADDLADRL